MNFGPLNFGLYHRHLQPAFERRGFQFIALRRMGMGPFEDQIAIAHKQVMRLCRDGGSLHLLGHSSGGVVARGLAHRLKSSHKVLSVASIASPHRGSLLADLAVSFRDQHPVGYWLMKAAGYDVSMRIPKLAHLRSEALAQFNEQYPDLPQTRYASVVSGGPVKTLPLVLRTIARFSVGENTETDGIVAKSSQSWGVVLSEHPVDHLGIIGFYSALSPLMNLRNRAEFRRAVNKLADFFAEAAK